MELGKFKEMLTTDSSNTAFEGTLRLSAARPSTSRYAAREEDRRGSN
jgi:hypothetical protein